MDFDSRGNLNKLIASVHEQIKPFKCNICDASFTKMGQIPIWRIAVIWRKEAIQITNNVCTVKCSYWGKYNPNLENCSYCEGRKPYYVLKNFLLLLYNYLFSLVLFQFSRIKKFITYYLWCHEKVSSHNQPVFSIHEKLKKTWKFVKIW